MEPEGAPQRMTRWRTVSAFLVLYLGIMFQDFARRDATQPSLHLSLSLVLNKTLNRQQNWRDWVQVLERNHLSLSHHLLLGAVVGAYARSAQPLFSNPSRCGDISYRYDRLGVSARERIIDACGAAWMARIQKTKTGRHA
ncbi:hypothetical protein K458DRAFT_176606 [Lentithecium fluviatile CBS 122367]|uniref:Uncharacterized protein n=1 Tax=Lentithecium fluviatile CBS 122367 TaxID=1168545 RepID=A0A6G1JDJ7_9PLEO|nr:hypothetical protein K458DRAFT_176606 [Lentithecium fluviatile CBS 122367]